MAEKLSLTTLPNELLVNVVEYLDHRDISSLSRVNRRFHWLCLDILLEIYIKQPSKSSLFIDAKQRSWGYLRLFFYAVKHDSASIVQWLSFDSDQLDLKGFVYN
jgi:hypothetical protein